MYPITDYLCGVCAGDTVRLRKDLIIRCRKGKPTGRVHHAGEIWTVLSAPATLPIVVRLEQADGKIHKWSDDADFLAWFEKIESSPAWVVDPEAAEPEVSMEPYFVS